MYFKNKIKEELAKHNLEIPEEKWFLNLPKVGNVGAASIYMMIEDLVQSGKLKKGQKIFLSVPESARFSYAYALLTVC
jgi:3-oxoacyl-[acyl-carrier-protein] synthase-3